MGTLPCLGGCFLTPPLTPPLRGEGDRREDSSPLGRLGGGFPLSFVPEKSRHDFPVQHGVKAVAAGGFD